MAHFKPTVLKYVQEARDLNRFNKSCHIAVLMQGTRKVCSYGINQMERQYYRGRHVSSLHAEIDCVRKCKSIDGKRKRRSQTTSTAHGYTLIVAKVSKNDNNKFYSSMPCKDCTRFLLEHGFKKIYCTTYEGAIVKVRLDDYVPYDLDG